MPYPILSLSYGLQKRLHSLATFFEVHDIQIAAGLEKHYIKPLMRYRKSECKEIDKDGVFDYESQRLAYEADLANNDEWIIVDADHVTLYGTFDPHLPHLNRVLITNTNIMDFENFNLNADVIKTMASKYVKPIECFYATDIETSLTFSTVFKLLPYVTEITTEINYPWIPPQGSYRSFAHANWVGDILKSGKNDLKSISMVDRPECLFDFTSEELHQLLHRQNLTLRIDLRRTSFDPGYDSYDDSVFLAKLYQHFVLATNKDYRIASHGYYLK